MKKILIIFFIFCTNIVSSDEKCEYLSINCPKFSYQTFSEFEKSVNYFKNFTKINLNQTFKFNDGKQDCYKIETVHQFEQKIKKNPELFYSMVKCQLEYNPSKKTIFEYEQAFLRSVLVTLR
jgi:hypothetical protein